MRRIVVVGASLAGVNAVQALRDTGYDGDLVLVGAEREPPYDRPPLSKEALSEGPVGHDLALRAATFYGDTDVRLRLDRRAVRLDPKARCLRLDDGERLAYDGLLVATGSQPRRLPDCPPGVHVLRTIADCAALRADLGPGRRLLIVGAGFIGLEVAATARGLGAEVTVLEVGDAPLGRALGGQAGRWLAARHAREGVEIRCGVGVEAVRGEPGAWKVRLTDGGVASADVVVLGLGVTAATGWLEGSGLAVGDGVLCDAYCRTSAPGVTAAGDVARWYNPLFDEQMRIEHWTNAVEQGRTAALNLLNPEDPAPYAPVPYFWSDQFSAKIRFVGRAFAAEDVAVVRDDGDKLVVLYGRDGVLRGALTVNAPRAMASYRRLIAQRADWADVRDG